MASRASRSIEPVDVFELARTGGEVAGRRPLTDMPRAAESLASPGGELVYRLQGFRDARGRPAARLHFEASPALICDRCSGPVELALEGEATYYFVRSEAELARIPVDESEEEPLLGSARFDLGELLEDELILALPISPRHADCAASGLTDDAPAAQPEPERPHPFAALAKLKSGKQ